MKKHEPIPRYFMTQATIDDTNRIAKTMMDKLRALREVRKVEQTLRQVRGEK
jgi:hypothetical protein